MEAERSTSFNRTEYILATVDLERLCPLLTIVLASESHVHNRAIKDKKEFKKNLEKKNCR